MKVKICGLTSVADALAAAEAGADWIGLNFHPPSPRRVGLDVASAICEALPPGVEPVGLFVNRPDTEVAELSDWLGLRFVQLHGDEPVEYLRLLSGFGVIRAFRPADERGLDAMTDYARRASALGLPLHAVLVDAFVPGAFGGTGQGVAPPLLEALRDRADDLPPLILAGGLTPENVAGRAAIARPWMVDVAGGVEAAPGRKDPALMAAFARAAKAGPA